MKGKGLHMITWILLIIGGLNWGLTAFKLNVVDQLGSQLSMIIYILVGLSAIYELITHKAHCKFCGTNSMGSSMGGSTTM